MKLSFLLAQRQALLRQVRLAHLAHAFDRLDDFAQRVTRARLRGEVHLQATPPESGDYHVSLTALQGSQAVLDEHFTEEDFFNLAEILSDVTGHAELDLTFPIEEIAARYLTPIRVQLEQAGVSLEREPSSAAEAQEGKIDRDHPKRQAR